MKEANKMVHAILSTLLRGLGAELDESAVTQYVEVRGVNMNYYLICPRPELTVGVGGLFVKVEDKGWIEIPPVEGALVINVGDTLEILSNGRYKSAEHRVLANISKARVSVPLFAGPWSQTMIGPLPGLPEKDGRALYRKVKFGEYSANYFGASHQGKKHLDFAKITNEE